MLISSQIDHLRRIVGGESIAKIQQAVAAVIPICCCSGIFGLLIKVRTSILFMIENSPGKCLLPKGKRGLIFTHMVEYQLLDDTLIALADPTRRAILSRLSQGQARVTDIAEPFSMSLNSVSKHIRILERANLVKRQKHGREHLLTLNTEPIDEAARWLEQQRSMWKWRLAKLENILQEDES